jgi:hypothetical protein
VAQGLAVRSRGYLGQTNFPDSQALDLDSLAPCLALCGDILFILLVIRKYLALHHTPEGAIGNGTSLLHFVSNRGILLQLT